uniref:hypothetical protein n=1 Tax=Altererythrobacter segetis TaxID=1104773 RepID=UPI00140DF1F8|nr:hypothetical protein [Altererythrobacter segetis]
MLALLPILLMTAQAAAPAGDAAPQGRAQVFIAPSGEPFRVYGEVPYPVADWFSGADKNADGKLDFAEFNADFLRFFDTLDVNHDGAIDSIEKTRYEGEVAPETLGGSWTGARAPDSNKEWASKFGDDVDLPSVDRPKRSKATIPIGAARFDLLGLPEPVAAMDLELRGRISRTAASEAAHLRFNQLDTAHRGYLTLDTLPATPVEGRRRR